LRATEPTPRATREPAPRTESAAPTGVSEAKADPEIAAEAEAPARAKRVKVTPDNLKRFWTHLNAHVQRNHSVLGVWLAQGWLDRIEDDRLVFAFNASHGQARDYVEQPASRAALEEQLRALTTNITGYSTQLENRAAETAPEKQSHAPVAGLVTPEEAKAAMDDPAIAQVMDVFRGRIVQVKHNAPPPRE
jgi:hypothetical protein